MHWMTILSILALANVAHCDYSCLCNYNAEKTVFNSASIQADILGYMYEFDCKPSAGQSGDNDWLTVAFEHQIGYVEKDAQIQVQTCPGAIPDEDKLPGSTVTVPPSTTLVSSTVHPTTSVPTTNTMSTATTTVQTKTIEMSTTTSSPLSTTPSSAAPTITITSSVPSTQSTTAPSTASTKTTSLPTTPITTTTIATTSVHIKQTTNLPTTDQSSTTVTTLVQGHVELCPPRVQNLAGKPGELLAQFGQKCYEVDQSAVSWSHAEANCKQYGGHLVHIDSQQEQEFIYQFLVKHHSHSVWLGLHDRKHEEHFEWVSGAPLTYMNWKPNRKDDIHHSSEDCVFMSSTDGLWDDIQCGGDNALSELFQGHRHAYICEYATIDRSDGDLSKCSDRLRVQVVRDGGVLAQHDQSCYELISKAKVSWQHAEEICQTRGGHLAHIMNAEEQAFLQNFTTSHYSNHAVWIGLTDHNSEGHFHWTSGSPAHYTNWVPDHISNFVSHHQEDCTVFIPYKNGMWDDIPCGFTSHSIFGGASSSGETHPLLCQYHIANQPTFVG